MLKLKKYNFVQIIKTILMTLGAFMVGIALLSPQELLNEDTAEVKYTPLLIPLGL